VLVNLVHEHGPEVYFSWIMGADEEVSFTDNHIYATVGVYPYEPKGEYTFKVVDEADGSVIAEIKGQTVNYLSTTFHPHVTISPDRALFRLPMDGKYSIVVETEGSCDYGAVYMPTAPSGLIDQDVYLCFRELTNGSSVVFTTGVPLGDEWDYIPSDTEGLGANQIRSIQGYENLPVSWRTIIISIILLPVVLIMILTWLALFITSKIRKTDFRSLDYLLVCVLLILVVFDGIFILIVRNLTYQMIIRGLIALTLVGISLKRKRAYTPVTTLLIVYSLADITLIFNRYISTVFMIGAFVYMVVICMKGRKVHVNRIIYWSVTSTIVTLLMVQSLGVAWYEIVILCISLTVPFASWDKSQSMRSAGVLIVFKQVLFILFLYTSGVYMSLFFAHTAVNYLAMLILAMGNGKREKQHLIS
jgi:hypothetical protein